MLIGQSFEQINHYTALENAANHAADTVRNIWLEHVAANNMAFEEGFSESAEDVKFMAGEGFPGLIGIDYILKWWGNTDLDEAAGELEVLWKVQGADGIAIYKSWLRMANRDFVLGSFPEEQKKREANRTEFRKAFDAWQAVYSKVVG